MENAVLVGLITPQQPEERTNEYLDELAFLADTRDIKPVKRFVQRVNSPDTNTYVGSGKLEEIRQYIIANSDNCPSAQRSISAAVSLVIFDDELSPRQIRNIERDLNWRDNPKE
jgi:GTP-binding protein HflX